MRNRRLRADSIVDDISDAGVQADEGKAKEKAWGVAHGLQEIFRGKTFSPFIKRLIPVPTILSMAL